LQKSPKYHLKKKKKKNARNIHNNGRIRLREGERFIRRNRSVDGLVVSPCWHDESRWADLTVAIQISAQRADRILILRSFHDPAAHPPQPTPPISCMMMTTYLCLKRCLYHYQRHLDSFTFPVDGVLAGLRWPLMIQTGLPDWSNFFDVVCLFLSSCKCPKHETSANELVFCTGFQYFPSHIERVPKGLHRFLVLFWFYIVWFDWSALVCGNKVKS
jgi:hypothetical protein